MKIAVIGTGAMGGSLAIQMAKHHELVLFDKGSGKAAALAKTIGAKVGEKIDSHVDAVLIAVKPGNLEELSKEIGHLLTQDQLIVSVASGVEVSKLQTLFSKGKVVRAMPNLPVQCGEGVIGLVDAKHLALTDKQKVEEMFRGVGLLKWVSESKIEALTMITGCGPGFAAMIIESFVEAGIAMGLSSDEALSLTLQMFKGSVALLHETGEHPSQMKWKVCSPGGVTIAGLNEMEACGVRAGIISGIHAAYNKE